MKCFIMHCLLEAPRAPHLDGSSTYKALGQWAARTASARVLAQSRDPSPTLALIHRVSLSPYLSIFPPFSFSLFCPCSQFPMLAYSSAKLRSIPDTHVSVLVNLITTTSFTTDVGPPPPTPHPPQLGPKPLKFSKFTLPY